MCERDARHERDPAIIVRLLIDLYIYARACESVCERESVCICACGARHERNPVIIARLLIGLSFYVYACESVRESLRVCVCVSLVTNATLSLSSVFSLVSLFTCACVLQCVQERMNLSLSVER